MDIQKCDSELNNCVLTVTLNPAIDKTCTIDQLLEGNVNRLQDVRMIAGGKGINVTKILRQYGYRVIATGVLGGSAGAFIEEKMTELGVECQFVHLHQETRTNTNILAANGKVTEILEPGPEISEVQQAEFLALYDHLLDRASLVVISGSAVRGFVKEIYSMLIKMAKQKKVTVFLDTSGEGLTEGIGAIPDLIKPNLKELEYIMQQELPTIQKVVDAAKTLQQKGIKQVYVSMGEQGLISVGDNNILLGKTDQIEAVNTVGCGDSVVASCAMSYSRRLSQEEALRQACAISAANATTFESAVIPLDMAEKLAKTVTIEQLL